MPKQTVTVEVDCPAGYELTGEYRVPRKDEWYLCGGIAQQCEGHDYRYATYFILRKLWQPPSWLPDGCWCYKNTANDWYVTDKEPLPELDRVRKCTAQSDALCFSANALAKLHGETFVPPPVDKIQIKRQ